MIKFRNFLEYPGNLTILEQQIDSEVQLEYFNYANKINVDFNPDEVLKNRDHIFRHDLPVEDKKHLLYNLQILTVLTLIVH